MTNSPRRTIVNAFNDVVERIFEHYSDSKIAVETISDYEADELLTDFETNHRTMSSLILMEGDNCRFATAVVASSDCLNALGAATYPLDWIGELSNMVMGALKNRLLEYGIEPRLGLPIADEGLRRDYVTQVEELDCVVVSTDTGPVFLVLHLDMDQDLQWQHDPARQVAAHSRVRLFANDAY